MVASTVDLQQVVGIYYTHGDLLNTCIKVSFHVPLGQVFTIIPAILIKVTFLWFSHKRRPIRSQVFEGQELDMVAGFCCPSVIITVAAKSEPRPFLSPMFTPTLPPRSHHILAKII